jgi:hypothetical protein
MPEMIEPLMLHEDVFYEYFKPYRHPQAHHNIWGGHGLETFGEDLRLIRSLDPDSDYVWTVVDGDSGNDQWITPGVRYVNRVCYLVTEKSHHGIEVDFRCPFRLNSLTPLGLKRQINKLRRALRLATHNVNII